MLATEPEPRRMLCGEDLDRALEVAADGSGYCKGLTAAQLSPTARILAAADRYQAMTQERPHRPAPTAPAAAAELRRMAADGHVDRDAAECVLAAGQPPAF